MRSLHGRRRTSSPGDPSQQLRSAACWRRGVRRLGHGLLGSGMTELGDFYDSFVEYQRRLLRSSNDPGVRLHLRTPSGADETHRRLKEDRCRADMRPRPAGPASACAIDLGTNSSGWRWRRWIPKGHFRVAQGQGGGADRPGACAAAGHGAGRLSCAASGRRRTASGPKWAVATSAVREAPNATSSWVWPAARPGSVQVVSGAGGRLIHLGALTCICMDGRSWSWTSGEHGFGRRGNLRYAHSLKLGISA